MTRPALRTNSASSARSLRGPTSTSTPTWSTSTGPRIRKSKRAPAASDAGALTWSSAVPHLLSAIVPPRKTEETTSAATQPQRNARATPGCDRARVSRGEEMINMTGEVLADSNRRFAEAAARSDAQAMASVYRDDAELLPPNAETLRGRPAIERFWQGAIEMGIRGLELETMQLEQADGLA